MEILTTLNLENVSEAEAKAYRFRPSARAVVFDVDGNIGLLHVSKHGYWKLPGGGIEKGEDATRGLERECEEELGCDIEIDEPIGQINEYRSEFKEYQESYIYFARVVGEKRSPNFDAGETELGFAVHWMPLPAAIRQLEACQETDDYMGTYVTKRDLIILQKAAALLS